MRTTLVATLAMVTLASIGRADPPSPIDPTPPEFPRWALGTGVQTEVELRALIGSDGKVREVEVAPYDVSRDLLTRPMRASFDSAAVRAVRGWTFRPATHDGKAVTAWWTLRVPFIDPETHESAVDSSSWSDSVASEGTATEFPEPIHRELPEWPAAAPYLCSGRIVVQLGLGRDGRVRTTRVAQDLLRCRDGVMATAVRAAALRAARHWRYRPAEVDRKAQRVVIPVAFRVPAPRTDAEVIVGFVRDSLSRQPRPGAEVFGAGEAHPFGRADDTGWFVLRGRATRALTLRARSGDCEAGGRRPVRLWKEPGDELTLFVRRVPCGDPGR